MARGGPNSAAVLAIAVAFAVIGLLAAPALADVAKLSGDLVSGGNVESFRITPDGNYAVYRADQDTDGVRELYSVPLSGKGMATRINPALPFGGEVSEFEISPDSSRVVYKADQDTQAVEELYSVPIAGPASAGVKLNQTPTANGDVFSFAISPDSSRVVYRADQDTNDLNELYSVPIAGPASAGTKLNQALAGSVFADYEISPDSSRAFYRADQDTAGVFELYSVPIAGPASVGVKLNDVLAAGGDVFGFEISPDSARVVYRADQDTDVVSELYSVPSDGPSTAGVKLNGTLPAEGDVQFGFVISPDSTRVVYRADQDVNNVLELYSVPLGGPASSGTKLNENPAAGGGVTQNFLISPDSSRVVYQADQDTDNVLEVYSVPRAGPSSAGVKLNGALATGGDVIRFRISPDSSRVAYQADQDTNDVFELYSVPLGGPASSGTKLNDTVPAGGDVSSSFMISPDSSRVAYHADQDTDDVFELYSVPLAGPASAGTRLSGPLGADGDVHFLFEVSPDSSPVVYRADQDTDEVIELYRSGNQAHDVGLFDPTQGRWHLRDAITGAVTAFFYGNPSDIPIVADWNCNGFESVGLFRLSDAFFYIRFTNTVGIADLSFFAGNPDDIPLAGDFNGDGCGDVALYRPSTQQFFVFLTLPPDGGSLGVAPIFFLFGNPGDTPVVGDFDGDGSDEVGLYRVSTGFFYWRDTLTTGIADGEMFYGDPGDRFVAGDWGQWQHLDGLDTPAIFRPSLARFFFRHTLTQGIADSEFSFGEGGWVPVAGVLGL